MGSGAVAGAVIGTAIGLTFLHAIDEHNRKYNAKRKPRKRVTKSPPIPKPKRSKSKPKKRTKSAKYK